MTSPTIAYYDSRADDPRFFETLVPEQITDVFELTGFGLIEEVYIGDGFGRDEVEWVTQVFK